MKTKIRKLKEEETDMGLHCLKFSLHFYAPDFEKVGSILVLACLCVRPSVKNFFKARVLKFHTSMDSSSKNS